jgi:hypothetical protein
MSHELPVAYNGDRLILKEFIVPWRSEFLVAGLIKIVAIPM